jgi:hypothetical protein
MLPLGVSHAVKTSKVHTLNKKCHHKQLLHTSLFLRKASCALLHQANVVIYDGILSRKKA